MRKLIGFVCLALLVVMFMLVATVSVAASPTIQYVALTYAQAPPLIGRALLEIQPVRAMFRSDIKVNLINSTRNEARPELPFNDLSDPWA